MITMHNLLKWLPGPESKQYSTPKPLLLSLQHLMFGEQTCALGRSGAVTSVTSFKESGVLKVQCFISNRVPMRAQLPGEQFDLGKLTPGDQLIVFAPIRPISARPAT